MKNDLIPKRRRKVEAEIASHENSLATLKHELEELDVAQSVFDRLSGAKRTATGDSPKEKAPPRKARKKPAGLPTTRKMVIEALMDARARGLPGLTPKGIREYVFQHFRYNMGSAANTVPSRLWRVDGEIEKDVEAGLFSLPKEIEAPDDLISRSAPGASCSSNPVQGGEARPGGGA